MEKLAKIMAEKGFNASSLSDEMSKNDMKLSRVAIGNILNGNHSPKLSTLEDIAAVLDVHVCDFLDGRSINEEDLTDPVQAMEAIKRIMNEYEKE